MRRSLFAVLVALIIVILFFIFWSQVPSILARNLSNKTGVEVSIRSLSLRPSAIVTRDFVMGNPKEYTLPKAFSASEIILNSPLSAYFSQHIVVDEIVVNDIYLGLEFNSTSSSDGNWTEILHQYQESAHLSDTGGKQVTIKKLVCNNIRAELKFRDQDNVRTLPTIKQIVITDISTEGGFPTDQLMSSILGQMVKQVFVQENLQNMLQNLLREAPGKAVESFIKPFKDIFNAVPIYQSDIKYATSYVSV